MPATGREGETRPLVILTNGYDATVTEMYFASAVAVARAGFHCLFFDGPGQGELLIEQGIPMRPDWETVIRAVVDFALALPRVDPRRIALSGWSLGGYLALRGASGEPRLAACIADPGLRAVMPPEMLIRMGVDPADPGPALEQAAASSPRMHWALAQRGLWVHGVKSFGAYAAAAMAMTLEGRVERDRLPHPADDGGGRPAVAGRRGAPRRAHLPEDPPPLHRGGGRRRALRDGQPLARQPQDARLAGGDAGLIPGA